MTWRRPLAVMASSLAALGLIAVLMGTNASPTTKAAAATTNAAPTNKAAAARTKAAAARTKARPVVALPPAAPAADPARIVTPGLDSPNPFVLAYRGVNYMYSSQYSIFGPSVPVRTSTPVSNVPAPGASLSPRVSGLSSAASGLTRWSHDTDAMPNPPAWVERGFTWSPDVRRVGGHFVMWFSAALAGWDPVTKCIGVATSASPLGPFVGSGQPSICQLDHKGSIDPRTFKDANGALWIDWKSDDNADLASNTHSSIYSQRLSPDGTKLMGAASVILSADQAWEGRIVEAPQMILAAGHYWLFYSGNWFNEPYYGIGVAECRGPVGPCHKYLDRPWLASNAQGTGPGEASLFTNRAGTWILYSPQAVHYRTYTARPVALAYVAFGPFGPYLASF